MGETFQKRISALLLSNRRHARYLTVLVCSALVVALGVAVTLMRPGQAKTHEEVVLDCQYSGNGAHTHDASCYDANGSLVCPLEERGYHVHDDSCYASETYLVCGLEEGAGAHTHDESCYDEEGNLVCDLEESAGHVHDDSCWQTDTWLDCGKEEITEEHVHGDGCFKTIVVEDVEPEETSEPEPEVKDAEPEPEANTNTKVETPAKKVTTASEPATATTADNGDQTFVGQLKDEDDNVVLAVNVKAPKDALPEGTTMRVKPIEAVEVASKVNEVVKAEVGEDKVAKSIMAVDIAFLDKDGNEIEPSKKVEVRITTAVVKDIDSPMLIHIDKDETKDPEVIKDATKVNADEKDTSTGHEDTLKFDTDKFSPYIITEVGTVDQEQDETAGTEEAASFPAQEFESETDELIVKVSAPEGAFPADTTMTVAAVDDEETIESVSAAAAEGVENAQVAKVSAVDITFTDVEGNEIQPLLPINVTMTSKDAPEQNDLVVVHVDNEGGASVVDQSVLTTEADEVVFKADSFSVYAVVEMETISTKVITADGDTFSIDVTYGPEAGIPEGATLAAHEILPDDSTYENLVEESAAAVLSDVEAINHIRLFDISILSAEGTAIEPLAPVQVKIAYDTPAILEDSLEIKMVHFAGSDTEVIDAATNLDENGSMDEVTFEAASFSTYAIVSTATSNLDGKTYAMVNTYTHDAVQGSKLSDTALNKIRVTVNSDNKVVATGDAPEKISTWKFTSAGNNNTYYIQAEDGQYLNISNSGVRLVNNRQAITVTAGTGNRAGMVRLVGSNNQAMNDFGGGDLAQGISNYNGNNNDEWFHLYELGDIANPPIGITIHYVDGNGNKLAEDKDITETTKTDGAPNYNDTYAFGDIYDLYQPISGYAYQSTHLDSIEGKQINAEVVYKVADSYTTNNSLVYPNPTTPVNTASYQWEYQEPYRSHTSVTAHDLQTFGNTTDVYVVYAEGEETIPSHGGGGGADTGDLEEPKPTKTLTPNNDGTYELSLSVNASSKDVEKTRGANVVLVWDKSASMNTSLPGGGTRLSKAKDATRELVDTLLGINEGRAQALVNMVIVPFCAQVEQDSGWQTDAGTLKAWVNGLAYSNAGGTNWIQSLETAKALADAKHKENGMDTYVIHMTDGNPWLDNMQSSHDTHMRDYFEKGAYFYATEPARQIVKAGYELYGVGIYGNVDVLHLLLNFAYSGRSTYDPSAGQDAYGHFALAQDQEALLEALRNIAGEIEGRLDMAGVEIKDGVALDTTHTSLSVSGKVSGIKYTKTAGKDEGSTAFTVRVGSNGVPMFSINGGAEQAGTTVSKTYTKLTKTDSGDVIASDATADVYRLAVGTSTYEMASASLNADGNLDWDLSPLGKLEDGATYTITTTVWPDQDAYDLVTDLNNGVATWNDSAATPVVEDGKVVFYQGGASKDGKQYPHIVKYPDGHYAALSNTYQTLDYFVVDTEDGQTTYEARPTINMKFPDPMGLVDNTITIEKQWEKDMMPGADIPSSVTVSLLRDGKEFIPDIELKASEDWKTTKFIAPGMMISKEHADARLIEGQVVNYDGGVENYVILNTGYDYKFAELWQQRFQLKEQTYHPMLVDNELWDVKIEGNNVTPIAKLTTGLVATNELKGGINIKKVVKDSVNNIIDSNDVFDVAVTLSVPRDENDNPDFTNVDKFFVGDTVRTESVAWYAYYDENDVRQYDPALIEAGILTDSGQVDQQYGSKIGVGENHPLDEYYNYGSGWFMVDFDDATGTVTGNVKVSDKYVLRFSNMAAGTSYSVAENVPAGYEASYAYEHVAYVDGKPLAPVPDGDTHVVVVNQGNNVTITNKQISSDLIIIKADENGKPITSANDTAKFELVVNTASDGSGSWESAVDSGNAPHKIGTDGTFTINTTDGIELKGLKDGIYRLTELKAPEGYVILKEPMTFKLAGGVVKFVTITKSGSGDEEVWTVTELEELDGYTITPKTTDSAAKLTVNNTPGASLPRTGGPGTTLFTITGSAMMALAVTYGISSRRRREGRSHT